MSIVAHSKVLCALEHQANSIAVIAAVPQDAVLHDAANGAVVLTCENLQLTHRV
jgi:hypothetical protein